MIMDSEVKRSYFLRSRVTTFTNILKWIAGRFWGTDAIFCINFINATIGAQLEWKAIWNGKLHQCC